MLKGYILRYIIILLCYKSVNEQRKLRIKITALIYMDIPVYV